MRIAFCYPPFTKNGRYPNLTQNRQFIYTSSREVKIFPVVMATAATWLQKSGHEVLWLDGVTRRMGWPEFENKLHNFAPEMIILESKAPIMPVLWGYINKLKSLNSNPLISLVGDHVSFFPEESLLKSKADYIITGGDYDFLLRSLVGHLTKKDKLLPGIYYKKNGKIVSSGEFNLKNDLDKLPLVDRKLTRWQDYGEAYLYHPCAYILTGRGCGIDNGRTGACTFCIWEHAFWKCQARLRNPKLVAQEVKSLVELGVREIFDDNESGALASKVWLSEFYNQLKREKILGKVVFSSNARGDQLTPEICRLLKKIGYRLLKVGLETGSEETLKLINKKENLETIVRGVKTAKDFGLRVMLTVMTGYPWESPEDVLKTYRVTKELMAYKTRAGDCLQASVVTPYPGSPLWVMARKNKWLKVKPFDYEKYDMDRPILKTKYDPTYWCNKIWSIQSGIPFILKSGLSIGCVSDVELLLRGALSLLGHKTDFK